MKKVSIVKAKQILEELVEDVNNSHVPIILENDQGKDCVLVSLEDWNAIQETLYINSVPGLANSIEEGMSERIEDCEVYDPKSKW